MGISLSRSGRVSCTSTTVNYSVPCPLTPRPPLSPSVIPLKPSIVRWIRIRYDAISWCWYWRNKNRKWIHTCTRMWHEVKDPHGSCMTWCCVQRLWIIIMLDNPFQWIPCLSSVVYYYMCTSWQIYNNFNYSPSTHEYDGVCIKWKRFTHNNPPFNGSRHWDSFSFYFIDKMNSRRS